MKKAITFILSTVILLATLMSAASAGEAYRFPDDEKFRSDYEPNVVVVFLKQEYKCDSCGPEDFPELPVEKVIIYNRFANAVRLSYVADSDIPMQEALERAAQSPMAESVYPMLSRFAVTCDFTLGDLTGNLEVNSEDLVLLMQYLSSDGSKMLDPYSDAGNAKSKSHADTNQDGVIDVKDLAGMLCIMSQEYPEALKNIPAEVIDKLPAEVFDMIPAETLEVLKKIQADAAASDKNVVVIEPVDYYLVIDPTKEHLVILGDANLDGKVDAKDITHIMKHCVGWGELSEDAFKAVDINCDGEANAKDIVLIMKMIMA